MSKPITTDTPFEPIEIPGYLERQNDRLRIVLYIEDNIDDISKKTGIRRELLKDAIKRFRRAAVDD